MKKRIVSLIAVWAVAMSILPTSYTQNYDVYATEENIEAVADEAASAEGGEAELSGDTAQLAAGFTPRTSAPSLTDYWYKSGVNPLRGIWDNGNCTWYAWGRASEIKGAAVSSWAFRHAAATWWTENKNNNIYPYGQTPAVGAIAVWGACSTNSAGHVAIVEAVNGDYITISESSHGGVWYTGSYWGTKTYTTYQLKEEQTNDKVVMPFLGFIYVNGTGTGGSAQTHTHSWSTNFESGHPHKQYRTCSCGAKEYTGTNGRTTSCQQCYPLGYVSFRREHNRIAKTATFYRNNVSNANSYEVTLYRDGGYYDSFSMTGTSRTVSNLRSGSYTATLTVRNTNTGQTKTSTCSSFRIVDSYVVRYDANGGTNTPSQQTKIKDESLAITSSTPVREHYIFKGWASSKTATEPQYEPGDYYTKNTPITLYAVWEPEVYTINFDPNGGDGEVAGVKITYGNTMKMPNDITRQEYYLRGWSKDQYSENVEYRIGVDYGFDSNTTLYAVWGKSTWSGDVATGFAGGDGTESNPYQISSSAELAYLAKKVNEQSSAPKYEYYILTNNIGLGYDEWTPIGVFDYENQYFYGSFDGNGYTISDLSVSQNNANNIGLFGRAKDSEIKNLTILGEVKNITSSEVMNIGGLVGLAENTNITDCSVKYVNISNLDISDTGYSNVGCVVGKTSGGEIKGCAADESNIIIKSGKFNMGIICGSSESNITDCSVTSTAELFETTGSEIDYLYMGGLCGYQTGNIEKCTVNAGRMSANDISVSRSYVGGLVGYASGNVNLCTVKFTNDDQKTIDGESYPVSISVASEAISCIGGIVGDLTETAKINDCMYDGKSISAVSSNTTDSGSYAGGLIGEAKAKTPKTIEATGGQSLIRSYLPKREGYTATWYTDPELKNEYDFSQPVTSDITLYAKWSEGGVDIWDGASSEPEYNPDTKTYTVTNGRELAWISDVTNSIITEGINFPDNIAFEGYTVTLADDIYLNDTSDLENWATTAPGNEWKPIGDFSGTFDGANHVIYGLYSRSDRSGLFDALEGTVKNVTMCDGYVRGYSNAAGIAASSSGTITNCNNFMTVEGTKAAGITAHNTGIIEGCKNMGNISFVYANYTLASRDTAGIAAFNNNNISGCYNSGKINSTAASSCLGGIVGEDRGTVSKCINTGSINENRYFKDAAGGIIGNKQDGTVSECYNSGALYYPSTGTCDLGGIVGELFGKIDKCYNTASISGRDAGGIAGTSNGDGISECYNTGYVSGSAGGITGLNAIGTMRCCYSIYSPLYDRSLSSASVTFSSIKTSSQMKSLSNLSGFSTSTWAVDSSINNGYPYLKSLEDTYKTYSVSVIEDVNDSAAVNRSFANIDGMLFSSSGGYAYAGGIIGSGFGTKADAKKLLSVADKISSKTSDTAVAGYNYAYAGDIIGYNKDNAFNFDTIFSNSTMSLSAVNTNNSENSRTNTIGTPQTESQLKRVATLNRIFGPDTYQSLEYLEEHPEAVWVIKDGELPELYYNVLRDITTDDVENGTITLDKTQAVDGERVTITATPAENYQLNKIYVNGEIAGDTFVVNGDSTVYATFTEKTPEYSARVEANSNADASLVDVDSESEIALASNEDTISAQDGNEIRVNTEADTDYAVEAVYVNGEELASDSFIITEDAVVSMDVINISTDIPAVTGDATDIGNYFATLSGSVDDVEGAERYIKYWAKDNPDETYITEVQPGGGDYSIVIAELVPETEYCYQMGETGEVKTFTTGNYYMSGDDITPPTENPSDPDIPAIDPETATFEIQNAAQSNGYVSANVVNISDASQSGTVVFAAYSDTDALITVEYVEIENLEANASSACEFPLPEGTVKSRLFVWSSWTDMIPLAKSVEIK